MDSSGPSSSCCSILLPGFKEGAEAGFEWGSIKAAAKSLEILCGQVPGTSQIQAQVRTCCDTYVLQLYVLLLISNGHVGSLHACKLTHDVHVIHSFILPPAGSRAGSQPERSASTRSHAGCNTPATHYPITFSNPRGVTRKRGRGVGACVCQALHKAAAVVR